CRPAIQLRYASAHLTPLVCKRSPPKFALAFVTKPSWVLTGLIALSPSPVGERNRAQTYGLCWSLSRTSCNLLPNESKSALIKPLCSISASFARAEIFRWEEKRAVFSSTNRPPAWLIYGHQSSAVSQ